MTPHKENNHTTKVLNDSEGDETLISELKRMMTRIIKELKEDMQKQVNDRQQDDGRIDAFSFRYKKLMKS
jgi:uncharacterized protein YrzB (UPF0473 family)